MSFEGQQQVGPETRADADPATGDARRSAPARDHGSTVLALQGSAGNAAVLRLLETGRLRTPASSSGAGIQRTPAAPSYGGQTGVLDPSKVRIDAVADFLVGSLTAPRAVNPHILDPTIVHMTWMLYDPADQMIGGWSTLPGNATSTTRPFELKPSHFAGPSFREGRHLLRLSGLNAQHRPVAYADRDFNVLSSDLTTGTGAATGHGSLTFTRYSARSSSAADRSFAIDVELSFLPDPAVQSPDVVFIQAVQYIDLEGGNLHRLVNAEQNARSTPLSWSIDRVAGAPQPFYIAGHNAAGRVVDKAVWGRRGRGGARPRSATLIDQPWGDAPMAGGEQMRFESCAISRSGPTAGECYGCATWGFQVDSAGQVTLMPRSVHAMPSPEFEEARQMWNTWRAGRPAGSRPTEAPATRSP